MPSPPVPVDQVPSLAALGWDDGWQELAEARTADTTTGTPARVLRHDGGAVLVAGAAGSSQARLRPAAAPLAVGDWVLVDAGAVRDVLPRRTLLRRRDPATGGDQLVAANVDVVAVVCGCDRPLRPGRVERVLTQTWEAGAVPVVVLTKTDVLDAGDLADVLRSVAGAAPGVEVVAVSARSGAGLDLLRASLSGHTVALVGESGAGKSSLVNALAGRERARTAGVRGGDAKGRHTTTARQLHLLPGDLRVLDTPGLRSVGLRADGDSVDDAFDDVAELARQCRFRDCRHADEPGCAVTRAVDLGALDADRLGRWHRLQREAASAARRADPRASRQEARRVGRMRREARWLSRDRD